MRDPDSVTTGRDLAALLASEGPLPVERAVELVLLACETIAEAHVLGVVHGRLSPAKLFCVQRPDGRASVRVLGFGAAEPKAERRARYLSPEQALGVAEIDTRTDVWSLGAVLFELLAGRPPFLVDSEEELALRIALDPVPDLGALCGDLPAGLERIVAECLAMDRALRLQTVGELAVALGQYAPPAARESVERVLGTLRDAGVPTSVPPSGPIEDALFSAPPPAPVPQVDGSRRGPTWRARAQRWLAALAVLGLGSTKRTPRADVAP